MRILLNSKRWLTIASSFLTVIVMLGFGSSAYADAANSHTSNVTCSAYYGPGSSYVASIQIKWSRDTTKHLVSIDTITVTSLVRNGATYLPLMYVDAKVYYNHASQYYRNVSYYKYPPNNYNPTFYWPQQFHTATGTNPQDVWIQMMGDDSHWVGACDYYFWA